MVIFVLQKTIAKVGGLLEIMWRKFLSYITFWRKGQNKTENFNLRVMHGINRVSILMFLIALIVLIVRFATRG